MLNDDDKWKVITTLAQSHGVGKEALRKWKTRGVPTVWQIKFVCAAPTALNFGDFSELLKHAKEARDDHE